MINPSSAFDADKQTCKTKKGDISTVLGHPFDATKYPQNNWSVAANDPTSTPPMDASGRSDICTAPVLLFNPDGVPEEMKTHPQRLVWKLIDKPGQKKPTKVPYDPLTKHSCNGASGTGHPFDVAYQCFLDGGFAGLGFALGGEDGLCCIDLDNVDLLNPSPLTVDLVCAAGSYTEVSQSGKGLHIFIQGKLPDDWRHKHTDLHIEQYSSKRFIAVTGNLLDWPGVTNGINPVSDALINILAPLLKKTLPDIPKAPEPVLTVSAGQLPPVEEIERVFRLTSDRADLLDYAPIDSDDWSSLDQALCNRLAGYCHGEPALIEAMWKRSPLGRRAKAYREDYVALTIQKAIASNSWRFDYGWQPKPSDPDFPNKHVIASMQLPQPTKAPFPFSTVAANFDFNDIQPRRWVIEGLLLRKYTTAILAPGGTGKSVYQLVLAVSIVTGRDLLGNGISTAGNVLVVNNEDDKEEIFRRLAADCIHYNIAPADLHGRLFLACGYGRAVKVLVQTPVGLAQSEDVHDLVSLINTHNIIAVFLDPLVSLHEAGENSNDEMDRVVNQFRYLGEQTEAAIAVAHHTRKGGTDSEASAGDVESSRGAKAVTDGCRSAQTMARMSKDRAKKLGIPPELARRLIRVDDAKSNYDLMSEEECWLKMVSVTLPNGEDVGVPEPFDITPYQDIADRKQQDRKRTAYDVIPDLEPVLLTQPDPSRVRLNDILPKFMNITGVQSRAARDRIALLSNDPSKPDRIKESDGQLIEYWLEKDGKHGTAPVLICRREL
ncbi:MAG: AAA family ATPase [Motiliproteus sp.]